MDKNSIGEIDDVSASTNAYIKKKYPALYPVMAIVLILAVAAFVASYLLVNFKWLQNVAIFAVFGCFAFRAYIQSKVQSAFMQQLALAVGFTYEQKGDVSNFKGHFLEIGHSQTIRDVLSGTYRNAPVRIFTYSFTIGYGKNQHTYSYTGFELKTKDNLPEIIIHPKSVTDIIGFGDEWKPNGTKNISLEGNFNDYFKVYAPENSEIETRQILAPDVMADLIDNYKEFIQEFSGDSMYVISTKVIQERASFMNLLSLIDKLYDKLMPTLEEMATTSATAGPNS